MNIAVDYGNTTAKVGIFEHGRLGRKLLFHRAEELKSFIETGEAEHLIVSSVSHPAEEVVSWSGANGMKVALTFRTPLPVRIAYATPDTLGVDRIAAVCGALELFPGKDCLVIDAGTCITYEFLDGGATYHGGGISPGITMRFEAMHRYTSRLPLVHAAHQVSLVGSSTDTSMQSGVMNGVRAEVDGIIQKYRNKYPDIQCVLCGGDSLYFENQLAPGVVISPDLVLIGLNKILTYSLQQ